MAALALSFSACGLKANPQPAALVRPETITDLSAAKAAEGVRLEWTRPDSYANGDDMPDLGGFKVFRGVLRALAREIADIKVSDRERFQRQRRFTFVDKDGTKGGSYYYRIVSYTTDQYYSAPSNQATIPAGP